MTSSGDKVSKFVDRLKNVVSTAQHAVNTAKNVVADNFLGNPVCREYEIVKHIASAGPQLSWKIYDAVKKTTKQEVSVFIFEKKSLEKMAKKQREHIFETLKGGCKQLTRLRHPRFLTIEHGVEESRESIAFATEPVLASLANLFGDIRNVPSNHNLKDFELYDVERKYGIMQLCEALTFIHDQASLIHGNLSPESVIISKSGAWKLAGLYFTVTKDHPQGMVWDVKDHPITRPLLNYLAPERVNGAPGDLNKTSADMFSLGVLIHALYNNGKPLYDYGNNLTTYKRAIKENSHLSKLRVPGGLQEQCKSLLSTTASTRLDANATIKTGHFEDIGAITLQYLDSLFQKDSVEKSRFFKNVHKVISALPKRVILQRVLTCLVTELTNIDMIPFVLPNVLLIAEQCDRDEYMSLIFPHIKPLFAMEEPIQILLIFMQRMDLILKLTPTDQTNAFVLPLVYRALESSQHDIQEICLSILPNHTSDIEYSHLKNNIIPRIKNLCLDTTTLSVRINSLVCIGKILPILDKLTVLDVILPMLQEIPSREAGVLMGILGIYKTVVGHKRLGLDIEHMSRTDMPFLIPLCVEASLNASQFSQYMSLLKDILNRIDSEQSSKLKQLGRMQEETASSVSMANDMKDIRASQQIDTMLNRLEKLWDVKDGSQDDGTKEPSTSSNDNANSSNKVSESQNSTNDLTRNQEIGAKSADSSVINRISPPPVSPPPSLVPPVSAAPTMTTKKPTLNEIQTQTKESKQTMSIMDGILQPTAATHNQSSYQLGTSTIANQSSPPLGANNLPGQGGVSLATSSPPVQKVSNLSQQPGISTAASQYSSSLTANSLSQSSRTTTPSSTKTFNTVSQSAKLDTSVFTNISTTGSQPSRVATGTSANASTTGPVNTLSTVSSISSSAQFNQSVRNPSPQMPMNSAQRQPLSSQGSNQPTQNLDAFMMQQLGQQNPQTTMGLASRPSSYPNSARQPSPGNLSQPMENSVMMQNRPMQPTRLHQPLQPTRMVPMQPLAPQQMQARSGFQPQQMQARPGFQPQQMQARSGLQPQQIQAPPGLQPQRMQARSGLQPQQMQARPGLQPQQMQGGPNLQPTGPMQPRPSFMPNQQIQRPSTSTNANIDLKDIFG